MKKEMKKVLNVLKFAGAMLMLALTFIIGFIDRIIVLPMFWKESPSLTKEQYYRTNFEGSWIRVVLLMFIVGGIYLAHWIIYWID